MSIQRRNSGEECRTSVKSILAQPGKSQCKVLHASHLQVILPELWDTAVDLFDASRAGVVSDRKRTQKVQEKVRRAGAHSALLTSRFANKGGSD